MNRAPSKQHGMQKAIELTQTAAEVGFDWPTIDGVFDKIAEEIQEIQHELAQTPVNRQRLLEEFGDILFAVANLARKLELDPDKAIKTTNQKFMHRFQYIETALGKQGKSPADSSLAEMDELWNQAKVSK